MEATRILNALQSVKVGLAGALLSMAIMGTAASLLHQDFPQEVHLLSALGVGLLAAFARFKSFIL